MNIISGILNKKKVRNDIFQHSLVQFLNHEFWSRLGSTCGFEFPGCVTLGMLTTLPMPQAPD